MGRPLGSVTRVGVLVVDDSVVVRRMVTTALSADPEIEVVGAASSGRLALEKIAQTSPDLVTLDIEMPELDGLETLREIRRRYPKLPVVMFSSLTERGATATLDALTLGANDYVTKPSNAATADDAMAGVRAQLIPKIKALVSRDASGGTHVPARAAASDVREPLGVRRVARPRPAPEPAGPVDCVVIGASTGGPDALSTVLSRLPATFPLPVLVVQHMPPLFTRLFAQRLDQACAVRVREAGDGEPVEAGTVLIAPGDYHLAVQRQGTAVVAALSQEGPENWVRPAADVLFRSAAEVYGARCLAVVLTGMGQDGLRGCDRLSATGARVVVQDEASSVVWGMPGAVAAAGLADRVLPLTDLPDHLLAVAARSGRTIAAARRRAPASSVGSGEVA